MNKQRLDSLRGLSSEESGLCHKRTVPAVSKLGNGLLVHTSEHKIQERIMPREAITAGYFQKVNAVFATDERRQIDFYAIRRTEYGAIGLLLQNEKGQLVKTLISSNTSKKAETKKTLMESLESPSFRYYVSETGFVKEIDQSGNLSQEAYNENPKGVEIIASETVYATDILKEGSIQLFTFSSIKAGQPFFDAVVPLMKNKDYHSVMEAIKEKIKKEELTHQNPIEARIDILALKSVYELPNRQTKQR